MKTNQHQLSLRAAGLLAAGALTLGLVACGERVDTASTQPNEPTVGQRVDAASERTANAAGNMAQNVERKVDDAAITASVNASLAKDPDLSAMKIDVDTKSGVVTLSGPAPTAAAKDRATSLAQAVDGVAGVNNNLEVRAG
nr:BON domain-containing protein [Variovorax boronicumulans]